MRMAILLCASPLPFEIEGEIAMGIVYDPFRDELFMQKRAKEPI